MDNKENTEVLGNEQAIDIIKSCEIIGKHVDTLKLISRNLQNSSDKILNNNTRSNTETQSGQLWHELNNVEHQLKQFTQYTETSIQDFAITSKKLIENLRSLRQSKDV